MKKTLVSIFLAMLTCLAGCSSVLGAATPSDTTATDLAVSTPSQSNVPDDAVSTPSDADEVSGQIDELTIMPTSDALETPEAMPESDKLVVDNDDDKGKKFIVSYNENEETVQIGDIEKNDSGMLTIRLFSTAFTGNITDDPADMFPVLACVVIDGTRYDPMPQTGGNGFMDYCFDTKLDPDEILISLYAAFAASDYDAFVSVNPRTKLPV